MKDVVISALILLAYLLAVFGWWARRRQLDRQRRARQRIRRINNYTMRGAVISYPVRRANVVDLDNYSRKVDVA